MTGWFRWLVGLDFEPQERCWAWRELNRRVHDEQTQAQKVTPFRPARPEYEPMLERMRRRA